MLLEVYRAEILCSWRKGILVNWPQSAGFCCVKGLARNLDVYFRATSFKSCLLISLFGEIRIL